MSWRAGDALSRTVKLEVDDGSASTFAEAEELVRSYTVQIVVGADVESSLTLQTMLLTAVNTAARACLGGVRVVADNNPTLQAPWAHMQTLSSAVRRLGGTIAKRMDLELPTMVIGHPNHESKAKTTIIPTWQGWAAAVVLEDRKRLPESLEFPLAGVLAAGLAVSELFNHLRGLPEYGDREVGLSLWLPGGDWRDPSAFGPASRYLPTRLWLAGLGHLGQAYAWALGTLPYANLANVHVLLQDYDVVQQANESTSALCAPSINIGTKKTRVVAAALEGIGFSTDIVERPFDGRTKPNGDEPRWVLAGFDRPGPRRHLGCFDFAVDCGLGSGPIEYLDLLVHAFPADLTPERVFPEQPQVAGRAVDRVLGLPAYDALRDELARQGASEGEALCGAIDLAGRTVAASFVGAAASAIALSEVLRQLEGGPAYEVISFSLREPQFIEAVPSDVRNIRPAPFGRTSLGDSVVATAD